MKLLIIILILHITHIYGMKAFWKGGPKNGYLGYPSKDYINQKYGGSNNVKMDLFTQDLGHFNPANDQTFPQLYYVNQQFYKKGGPVFLMIGGAGITGEEWMAQGAWIHYAKKFNALCFLLEHRFYGKSHPKDDLSTENLIYLGAEQALTDLVYFIMAMNEKYDLDYDTKWIAFGGSYAGTLAAWLRGKFPHLIHGVISSSAPLHAKADFIEYYQVVEESLKTYSNACVDFVRKAFWDLELLLRNNSCHQEINEQFKLCHPIQPTVENKLDMANLFEILANRFGDVVQYNKVNSPHATVSIDDVCKIMTNSDMVKPVHRLAQVNSLIMDKQNIECLDHLYENMIQEIKETSWESKSSDGSRQWAYQGCTGFGFYKTSGNMTVTSIFGNRFPINFFVQQCIDIFGLQFSTTLTNAIHRTNAYFGGLNPSTTNVLYVQGSIDPWRPLGLTETTDENCPTILIEGTAHCADMYEPAASDIQKLKQARQKIEAYIKKLLK